MTSLGAISFEQRDSGVVNALCYWFVRDEGLSLEMGLLGTRQLNVGILIVRSRVRF